jgi:hypothetical protein
MPVAFLHLGFELFCAQNDRARHVFLKQPVPFLPLRQTIQNVVNRAFDEPMRHRNQRTRSVALSLVDTGVVKSSYEAIRALS